MAILNEVQKTSNIESYMFSNCASHPFSWGQLQSSYCYITIYSIRFVGSLLRFAPHHVPNRNWNTRLETQSWSAESRGPSRQPDFSSQAVDRLDS